MDPATLPLQQTDLGCDLALATRWEAYYGAAMVGVQAHRSRAVPWLYVARVVRFGRSMEPKAISGLVTRLRQLAFEKPVLRLHLEVWSENLRDRQAIADACLAEGFRRTGAHRSYRRTVWIDLSKSVDDLLAGFSKGCRQSIRTPAKRGYVVRQITDVGAAERLEEIITATFRRTGGTAPRLPWSSLIKLGSRARSSVRLVGLFREREPSTRSPVSFALAYLHGDVAEYAHAGSVRDDSVGSLPLLYAPTWELMQWAKSRGALSWDFGGISEDADSLAGIDASKLAFSTNVVEVGDEWFFEPRRAAAFASQTAGRIKALAVGTKQAGVRAISAGAAPAFHGWL